MDDPGLLSRGTLPASVGHSRLLQAYSHFIYKCCPLLSWDQYGLVAFLLLLGSCVQLYCQKLAQWYVVIPVGAELGIADVRILVQTARANAADWCHKVHCLPLMKHCMVGLEGCDLLCPVLFRCLLSDRGAGWWLIDGSPLRCTKRRELCELYVGVCEPSWVVLDASPLLQLSLHKNEMTWAMFSKPLKLFKNVLSLLREFWGSWGRKALGRDGGSRFMALNTVVDLAQVKCNLCVICFAQLVECKGGSWHKIKWGEECRILSGKVTLFCVCFLTAKWMLGCPGAAPFHSILRRTQEALGRATASLLP